MKRRLLIIFLILIASILSLVLYVMNDSKATLTPWPKLLPNVRLEPKQKLITEAEVTKDNAYYYLRQLPELHTLMNETQLDKFHDELYDIDAYGYDPVKTCTVDAWLAKNPKPMKLINQAIKCKSCNIPYIAQDSSKPAIDIICPDWRSNLQEYTKLIVHSARISARRGNTKLATKTLIAAFELCKVSGTSGMLINYLVSHVHHQIIEEGCRELISLYNFTPEQIKQLRTISKNSYNSICPLDEVLRYEYKFSIMMNNELSPPKKNESLQSISQLFNSSQKKEFKKLSNDFDIKSSENKLKITFSHLIDYAGKTIKGSIAPTLDSNFKALLEREYQNQGPNLTQDLFEKIMCRQIGKVLVDTTSMRSELLNRHRASELYLAVAAYKAQFDKLPQKPQDLVPAFLDLISKKEAKQIKLIGENHWNVFFNYSIGEESVGYIISSEIIGKCSERQLLELRKEQLRDGKPRKLDSKSTH